MENNKLKIPPEFAAASREQQIELVHELWDQIAQDPESVPVPESHRQIIKERLEAYRADPTAGLPWQEVRDRILGKIRKR